MSRSLSVWRLVLVAGLALLAAAERSARAQGIAGPRSTEQYPIDDLLPHGDAASWSKVITTIVAPETWQQAGGLGSIMAIPPELPNSLVIDNRSEVHKQIAELLERVRRAIRESTPQRAPPICGQIGLTQGEAKVYRALQSPAQLEFIDTPLADVLQYLQDYHKIVVRMDKPALENGGIKGDTPVTTNLRGVALRSALRLMLTESTLTYDISDGVLWITTLEGTQESLVTRLYAVDELVETREAGGLKELQCDGLIRTIIATIAPGTWHSAGGRGTISAINRGPARSLVVCQTQQVHSEIADLLATMRRLAEGEPLTNAAEEEILKALHSRAQLEFVETPLQDVIDYLKDYHHIEIQLDVGVVADSPVTVNLKGVTLQSALRLVLREMGLEYQISDGVLLVTTPERRAGCYRATVHSVADLQDMARETRPRPAALEDLVRVVSVCIAPKGWHTADGRGAVVPYFAGRHPCLVVYHNAIVNERVAGLLHALRAASAEKQAAAGHSPAGNTAAAVPRIQETLAALNAPTTVDFYDMPVSDVAQYLRDHDKISIQFDRRAIEDEGISISTPVIFKAHDTRLSVLLAELLGKVKLTYVVCNEGIQITTPAAAKKWLYTAVYPLDKTLQRVPGVTQPEQAAEKITSSIVPKTWPAAGGPGTIAGLSLGNWRALVVTQTYDVHQQIADLLGRPGIHADGILPYAGRVRQAAPSPKKPEKKSLPSRERPTHPVPPANDPFGDVPSKPSVNPPLDDPFAPSPNPEKTMPPKHAEDPFGTHN
jgi:hypothetical protein